MALFRHDREVRFVGVRRWLIAGAILLCATTPSAGQVVTGRVLDAHTLEPIVLGELALVDSLGQTFDQTFSNQTGAFQLVADRPGSYYVMASSVGYHLGFDGVLDLGQDGLISIEFYLQPKPVELERITVTGSQIESRLENEGFFDRMEKGFGTFFDTKKVEESGASALSELLERLPGVYNDGIVNAGASALGGRRIFFRDRSPGFGCPFAAGTTAALECSNYGDPPGYCTPNLYIDGARVEGLSQGADVDIYSQMFDVAGVEVYTRTSGAPIEYASFTACGLILIWTKQGVG